MPSKVHFTGDARLIQKAQQRKQQKYKLFSQYKKALRDEESSGKLSSDHVRRYDQEVVGGGGGSSNAAGNAAGTAPPSGERPTHAQAYNSGAKKKHGAVQSAQKKFQKRQEEVRLQREVEQQQREAEQREKAAAKKRRADQHALFKKRTKRGQPVLGHQVDVMLEKIRRGA